MSIMITGANRGIGRGLFDHYQQSGATVLGTTRGAAPNADWLSLDIAASDAEQTLRDAVSNRPLDLLICNAGVYLDKGAAFDTGYTADDWAKTFAVNVTGVFQTIRALLPSLENGTRPRIAIISSIMASDERAPGGSYIYRASKAAVLNLGRNLAVDLKPKGIAVGIYHPGWVKTDMGTDAADISVDEAVAGLAQRFDDLSLDSTGEFLSYDGTVIPF